MNTNKLVIVINGSGGVGKDTLCDIATKHYNIWNISTIQPIKEIAKSGGWKGKKDLVSRKFLSDLKLLFTEYNNLPLSYSFKKYVEFLLDMDAQILFVHIREPGEIKKFVEVIPTPILTLLVKRTVETKEYGNMADDNVENYDYDWTFDNNVSKEEVEFEFMDSLQDMMDMVGVSIKMREEADATS